MPKVDLNAKRGYEASVPVKKIWDKLEGGIIDKNFCIPLGENGKKKDRFIDLKNNFHILATGGALSGVGMLRRVALATLLKFNKIDGLIFYKGEELEKLCNPDMKENSEDEPSYYIEPAFKN